MADPFGYEQQPWVPARSPFALADELEGAGDVAFNVADFPTEESIIAELEAEQAPAPQPGSIFEPVAAAAAREESQRLALANELQAPSWADAQMSPEAEAELTGEPVPPESYSQAQTIESFQPGAQASKNRFELLERELSGEPAAVPEKLEQELSGEPEAEPVIPVQDLSDEALAMRQMEQDAAAEEFRKKREREEFDAKTERDARRAEIHTQEIAKANQRTEELLARSQEIGRQFVDNDRWMDSRSTGSKIGIALSILSAGQLGILSGRGGNEALDFFQQQVSQDIETQKFNIQKGIQDLNRDKGLVATLYEQTGDINLAGQAASLAVYEAGIAKIEGEIARMDPEGTQAVSMEIKRRKLRADADAQRAAIAAKQRKNAMDEAKLNVELMDKESAMAKRAAEVRKIEAETARLNRRGTGRKREDVYPPEYFETLYPGSGVRVPMTLSQFDDHLARTKKVGDLNPVQDAKGAAETDKAVAEATAKERDLAADSMAIRGDNGRPIRLQDGSVWRHADHKDVTTAMNTTREMQRLADVIAIERGKNGGTFPGIKSEGYQTIKAAATGIDYANLARLGQGAMSEGDKKGMEALRGGVDATSQVWDALKGIDVMTKNAVDGANEVMRSKGYDLDKPWAPARSERAVASEKNKRDVAADIANPSSFEFKTPAEVFKDRKAQIDVFLQKKPSLDEIRDLATEIGNLKAYKTASGTEPAAMLSQDQVYDLVAQMNERYQELKAPSVEKFLKGTPLDQTDPTAGPRLQSPEDIYNQIVRGE